MSKARQVPNETPGLDAVWDAIEQVCTAISDWYEQLWAGLSAWITDFITWARRQRVYNRLRRHGIPDRAARFVAERCPVFLLPRVSVSALFSNLGREMAQGYADGVRQSQGDADAADESKPGRTAGPC